MAYRLAIFDFDGTLADSYSWFAGQAPAMVEAFNLRAVSPEEIDALRGQHARVAMRRLGVRWWQGPAIATEMRRRMARSVDEIHLFPGVDAALATLAARGLKLAIVSSNAESTVRAVLGPRQHDIHAFACGVSLFGKAAPMRALIRRAKVAARETIAIGDELRDLDAARSVGAAFGAVAWGYTTPAAFTAADHLFEDASAWLPALAPTAA